MEAKNQGFEEDQVNYMQPQFLALFLIIFILF